MLDDEVDAAGADDELEDELESVDDEDDLGPSELREVERESLR